MKWVLALIPLIISYHTFSYGLWVWRQGNRYGGGGVFLLAVVNLSLSFYALFIRVGF